MDNKLIEVMQRRMIGMGESKRTLLTKPG